MEEIEECFKYVICDIKVPAELKVKIYCTTIGPAMLYGTECRAVQQQPADIFPLGRIRHLEACLELS